MYDFFYNELKETIRPKVRALAAGAVVDLCKFGIHHVAIKVWNEKFKGTGRLHSPEQAPGAHEHEFTLFLLLTWLVKIGELGLFGGITGLLGCA